MEFSLFVIDSSPAIRRLVEEAASTEGFEVTAFSDGPSALDEAGRNAPRMIIADFHLEGLTFITFCDKLNDLNLIPSTMVVALVNASDRIDENGLRARGVNAFVRKPVQVEDLRKTIKEQNESRMAAAEPKPARGRRAWPPESITMGEDGPTVMEDEAPRVSPEPAKKLAPIVQPVTEDLRPASAAIAAAAAAKSNKARHSQWEPTRSPEPESPHPTRAPHLERINQPPPPPTPPAQKRDPSQDEAPAAARATGKTSEDKPFQFKPSEPSLPPRRPSSSPVAGEAPNGLPPSVEESMRSFLSNLLESLSAGSQGQINQLVSTLVAQHVNAELTRRIQAEVAAQVAAALAQDEIARAAREAAEQKLPELVAERVGSLEQSLRQDFSDRAQSMVKDITTTLVRDLAEPAVQKHLPDLVQQHMGSVDGLVKDAAKAAALGYTRDVAEKIVRQVADEQVGQLVSTAVADIAEAQIKKELERLTASD